MTTSIGRTFSLHETLKALETGNWNPFELFRDCPILEVRRACIQGMRRWSFARDHTNRIETDIKVLIAAKDPLWSEYLTYYVNNDTAKAEEKRSLQFAIQTCPAEEIQFLSKLVCNRVKFHPALYGIAQSFLQNEVRHFFNRVVNKREEIWSESEWHRVERALRVIVWHGDRVVLDMVRQVVASISRPDFGHLWAGDSTLDRQGHQLDTAATKAFLKEVVNILERKEAQLVVDSGGEI